MHLIKLKKLLVASGVLLLASCSAAFMFDGNEAEASQLAALKGQADAIQEALLINKCGVE